MKRGMVKLVLVSFLVLLSVSIISAVAPEAGKCNIVPVNECSLMNGSHIIMGLSAPTNAHGQFPYTNYPYVLCCAFGNGNKTCVKDYYFTNKIIGISSATNAHTETTLLNNYLTSVCYEDLECEKVANLCGSGEIGILSLSSDTNAHIGNFSDYSGKICCKGDAILTKPCTIKSASWDVEEAISGQNVHLQIVGSGTECIGQTIILNITGGSEPITTQPKSIMFTGAEVMGLWTAENQKCGIWPFETNCKYSFEASLKSNPAVKVKSDSPDLSVSARVAEACIEVDTCTDYTNQLDCNSDATVCNVAENSDPDIACDSESFYCGCNWNENATGTTSDPKCKFGYTEITLESCGSPIAGQGCGFGCTLCENSTGGKYCNVGSTCPSGIKPTNNNGSCDFGIDGCGSADCANGDRDSCAEGTYCVLDKCGNVVGPPLTLGSCKITQQITKGCEVEPVGYKMVTLTAEWIGETTGTQYENCIAKNNQQVRISCPAQVQLPFFDTIGIITAVLVIALIYVVAVCKKKDKHKKTKQRR